MVGEEQEKEYKIVVCDPDGNEAVCHIIPSLFNSKAFQISDKGIVVRLAENGKVIRQGLIPFAPKLLKSEDLKLIRTT